nr:DapH/DapD/GlmU-related protein [Exiguobacterium sp. s55]
MRNVDDTAEIIQSIIDNSAKVYKNSKIKNSKIMMNASIGDNSIVKNSNLSRSVSIHRNNYIDSTVIGDHSYTGMNTIIMHSEIGKFCSVSWNVTVGPSEHDYSKLTTHSFLYTTDSVLNNHELIEYNRFNRHCEIGNDVWIGCNSVVLRGVEIGTGAVIGANSVVTKDVPPYAIVVGNPAVILKYRFEKNIIDKILDTKWWDLPDEIIKENFSLISKNDININDLDYLLELREKIIKGD